MDPHIFADPDSGSQNLADPTDPDPKDGRIACRNGNGTDKLNEFCFALPETKFNELRELAELLTLSLITSI